MSEAKIAKKENNPVYEHVFDTPFEWEGKKYEKITFDFSSLTGSDTIAVEDEMAGEGKYVFTTMDSKYLIKLAARASNPSVGSDMLAKTQLKDFKKITGRMKSFLLAAELATNETI
jgi:hypothetical protein